MVSAAGSASGIDTGCCWNLGTGIKLKSKEVGRPHTATPPLAPMLHDVKGSVVEGLKFSFLFTYPLRHANTFDCRFVPSIGSCLLTFEAAATNGSLIIKVEILAGKEIIF